MSLSNVTRSITSFAAAVVIPTSQPERVTNLFFLAIAALGAVVYRQLFHTSSSALKPAQSIAIRALIEKGARDPDIDAAAHPFQQACKALIGKDSLDLWKRLVINACCCHGTEQAARFIEQAPESMRRILYENLSAYCFLMVYSPNRENRLEVQALKAAMELAKSEKSTASGYLDRAREYQTFFPRVDFDELQPLIDQMKSAQDQDAASKSRAKLLHILEKRLSTLKSWIRRCESYAEIIHSGPTSSMSNELKKLNELKKNLEAHEAFCQKIAATKTTGAAIEEADIDSFRYSVSANYLLYSVTFDASQLVDKAIEEAEKIPERTLKEMEVKLIVLKHLQSECPEKAAALIEKVFASLTQMVQNHSPADVVELQWMIHLCVLWTRFGHKHVGFDHLLKSPLFDKMSDEAKFNAYCNLSSVSWKKEGASPETMGLLGGALGVARSLPNRIPEFPENKINKLQALERVYKLADTQRDRTNAGDCIEELKGLEYCNDREAIRHSLKIAEYLVNTTHAHTHLQPNMVKNCLDRAFDLSINGTFSSLETQIEACRETAKTLKSLKEKSLKDKTAQFLGDTTPTQHKLLQKAFELARQLPDPELKEPGSKSASKFKCSGKLHTNKLDVYLDLAGQMYKARMKIEDVIQAIQHIQYPPKTFPPEGHTYYGYSVENRGDQKITDLCHAAIHLHSFMRGGFDRTALIEGVLNAAYERLTALDLAKAEAPTIENVTTYIEAADTYYRTCKQLSSHKGDFIATVHPRNFFEYLPKASQLINQLPASTIKNGKPCSNKKRITGLSLCLIRTMKEMGMGDVNMGDISMGLYIQAAFQKAIQYPEQKEQVAALWTLIPAIISVEAFGAVRDQLEQYIMSNWEKSPKAMAALLDRVLSSLAEDPKAGNAFPTTEFARIMNAFLFMQAASGSIPLEALSHLERAKIRKALDDCFLRKGEADALARDNFEWLCQEIPAGEEKHAFLYKLAEDYFKRGITVEKWIPEGIQECAVAIQYRATRIALMALAGCWALVRLAMLGSLMAHRFAKR